jgi:hypothetical protein
MIAIAKARCEEERGEGRAVSNKSYFVLLKREREGEETEREDGMEVRE